MRPMMKAMRWTGLALLAGLCWGACTDTNIYHRSIEPNIPNKVTLSGTVCTDDPAQRQFPVRVMFIVDNSGMMGVADPEMQRRYAIEDVINRYVASPNYSFAIVKFAGEVFQLTDGYTKNQAVLNEALGAFGTTDPCVGGCRDWFSALSLASSIFTGDALTTNPGTRSRTRYVFILVTSGPPDPDMEDDNNDTCDAACKQRLLDALDEMIAFGADAGVAELGFHAVQLDACPGTCQDFPDRNCNSTIACPAECTGAEDCQMAQRLCAGDRGVACGDGNAFCAGLGLEECSPEWLCTGDHATGCNGDDICAHSGAGRCEFVRVCAADPSLDCVRNEDCCPRDTCIFPDPALCLPEDDVRTAELLKALAFKGSGKHLRFSLGPQLNFWALDFDTTQSIFVKKAFMVTNANTLSQYGKTVADSDGDGLSDDEEDCYAEILNGECRHLERCRCRRDVWSEDNPMGTDTDPALADTDGDGLNDALEMRFATVNLDPLRMDLPQACFGLDYPYKDRDADTLNDCEEKLIGTDPTIFDTDRDGYSDAVEFRMGTNCLEPDHLMDTDMDGLANGSELEIHLNPQANDIAARSGEAYRYKVTDEGLRVVPYTSQPHMLSGVEITDVSGRSEAGAGTLTYHPAGTYRPDGSQRSYASLSWRDPADGQNGMEVEITGSGSYVLYSACACVQDCNPACAPGEWCNPMTGACEPDQCELVTCASTERCEPSSGRCMADCTLTDCDLGQRCDPLLGKCLTDRCLNMDCPAGEDCDPEAGVCAGPPCQGWSCAAGLRLDQELKPPWITVHIDEGQLPQSGMWCDGTPDNQPCQTDADCPANTFCRIRENIVVGMAQKNCISFRVKNVTLAETLEVQEGFGPGYNNIYAYFAQTPLDNPYAYSIFRAALVQVRYYNGIKEPNWSEIPLGDGDFYAIEEK